MLFGIPDTEKDLVWCTLDYKKDKISVTHVLLPAVDAAACKASKFPL